VARRAAGQESIAIAPADKTADGIGVIDRASGRLLEKLNVGSDPEAFAFTRDGKRLSWQTKMSPARRSSIWPRRRSSEK
jgi:hypothetical protein